MARFYLIGNPENRRVALFQHALQQAGHAPAVLISYLDVLNQTIALEQVLPPGAMVRIESPGENFAVEQKILALGGVEHAAQLPDQRGRIYYPQQWFRGFSELMRGIAQSAPAVTWFNHPLDIVTMFDKPLCKQLLPAHTLPACPVFTGYDAFFAFVKQQARARFFIKLNSSSSASGIVAYEYNRRTGQEHAWSTVEFQQIDGVDCFFNSLKIKQYTAGNTLRKILDFLLQQGALLEPWIAKAKHAGQSYDLRVMGIGTRRCHAIARLSHSPMTNLHLGNQRCQVDQLDLSSDCWAQIDTLVQHTMQQFPRSLYAGLDVLIPRDGAAPVLLEVNAFGDLLPNLLYQGKDTYLTEIEALLSQSVPAQATAGRACYS